MKSSMSDSWLLLQPGPLCLQQVYPQLMQFKTLVGLDVQATEQVLMASLERMSGWVLNLVHPHESNHPLLLRGALEQGIRAVQQVQPSAPAKRLYLGLDAMLQYLFQGLAPLRITAGAGVHQDIFWGIYSCSLSGWSKAHQCTHVQWQASPPPLTPPSAPYGLFAGRLLAGATLAFFEEHYPCALATLGYPQARATAENIHPPREATPAQAIVTAACSLVQRGIWNPQSPPHRLWRCNQQWHLLWPLAGADLQRELVIWEAQRDTDDPGQWIQHLVAAGCLQTAAQGAVAEGIHPRTRKKVHCVVASGALAQALDRLQSALTLAVGPSTN